MAALYLHIPFCRSICAYCDFVHTADLRGMDAVIEAMHRELDERNDYITDRTLRTIYFGGGTPSLLQPAVIESFIDHAAQLFDTLSLSEITIEANPDDLTREFVDALRLTHVNRLSIGIQSFDDDCLRMMRRRHTAQQADDAVRRAQDAGFDNITIDLMFGIDGFGDESLEKSLQRAVGLDVAHISAYHLTIEPSTLFGVKARRGELQEVDEERSESEFALVHERLTEAGYEHYEVSNYAREGYRSRHNSSYWDSTQYLGIGAGAHSFNGVSRYWAASKVAQYLAGSGGECEQLTQCDRRNEIVMTSLRRVEGLDLDEFGSLFGEGARDELLSAARNYLAGGLLRLEGSRIKIPVEKFLLSDSVIEALFVDNGL